MHRTDIASCQDKLVQLRSGQKIQTDLLISCTGYDDSLSAPFSNDLSTVLGLNSEHNSPTAISERRADQRLLESFPGLDTGTPLPDCRATASAWNLYRQAVSPSLAEAGDRSLVFLGHIHTISTPLVAEVQSLWAVAFLTGKLDLPSRPKMDTAVAEWNAWVKRRYLNQGSKVPYAIYDFLAVSPNFACFKDIKFDALAVCGCAM